LRQKDERRNEDSVIQAHFFQLLSRLPDLLPERDAQTLRANSTVLSQVLRIYLGKAKPSD
jgi:hypothetical protein